MSINDAIGSFPCSSPCPSTGLAVGPHHPGRVNRIVDLGIVLVLYPLGIYNVPVVIDGRAGHLQNIRHHSSCLPPAQLGEQSHWIPCAPGILMLNVTISNIYRRKGYCLLAFSLNLCKNFVIVKTGPLNVPLHLFFPKKRR